MDLAIITVSVLLPLMVCHWYSQHEYSMSLSDNFENWKVGKYAGIVLFIGFIAYMLISDYRNEYIGEFWFYFLEPSMFLCLIVYSKPASELVDGYSGFLSVGLNEDVAFILGWLGLLFVIGKTALMSTYS